MEEDRNAQAAAAICELAVAKYLNEYWHASVWHVSEHGKYRNIPDVGRNIEVRRVRTANGVTVRQTDRGKRVWAAKLADPEYRTVQLLGYVDADEVIAKCPSKHLIVPTSRLKKPWIRNSPKSTPRFANSALKAANTGP